MSEPTQPNEIQNLLSGSRNRLSPSHLFLTVLMGEDQVQETGPANFITTQDGIVELR
jgi:hypothetical protein